MNEHVKAIVFDVDGTLLYTIPDIMNSLNRVLARNGFPVHRHEEGYHFVGNGSLVLVTKALAGSPHDKETLERVWHEYNAEYAAHACDETCIYPGLKEVLTILRTRMTLFALSNKPDTESKAVLARYFGEGFFTDIQGERPGIPLKPDPTGLSQLLARNGFKTDEVLFVGDSDVDYRTAVNGGVPAICVLWGYRTKEELLALGATDFAATPADLLEMIHA